MFEVTHIEVLLVLFHYDFSNILLHHHKTFEKETVICHKAYEPL